jgi:hypothetical protein
MNLGLLHMGRSMFPKFAVFVFLTAAALFAQSNRAGLPELFPIPRAPSFLAPKLKPKILNRSCLSRRHI